MLRFSPKMNGKSFPTLEFLLQKHLLIYILIGTFSVPYQLHTFWPWKLRMRDENSWQYLNWNSMLNFWIDKLIKRKNSAQLSSKQNLFLSVASNAIKCIHTSNRFTITWRRFILSWIKHHSCVQSVRSDSIVRKSWKSMNKCICPTTRN